MLLASFRGFLLVLCATEDYERVNGAVEVWLRSLYESLHSASPAKGEPHDPSYGEVRRRGAAPHSGARRSRK